MTTMPPSRSAGPASPRPFHPAKWTSLLDDAESRTALYRLFLYAGQQIQLACTIPPRVHPQPHLGHQGQFEVGERRARRIRHVAPTGQAGGWSAHDEGGDGARDMIIRVAHAGAVQEQRVV